MTKLIKDALKPREGDLYFLTNAAFKPVALLAAMQHFPDLVTKGSDMTIVEIDCAVAAAGVAIFGLTILADWSLISPKNAVDENSSSDEMDPPDQMASIEASPDDYDEYTQDVSAAAYTAAAAETPDEVVGLLIFVEVLNQLRVRQGQDRPSDIRYAFSELRA